MHDSFIAEKLCILYTGIKNNITLSDEVIYCIAKFMMGVVQ